MFGLSGKKIIQIGIGIILILLLCLVWELKLGVAKECARFVLPLATPTRIYMTGSCRSWIHYIKLRSAHGTQKEHMDIANACKDIFAENFPAVSEALEWD